MPKKVKRMMVLITGISGRVGAAILTHLDGFDIRGFDRVDNPSVPTTIGDIAEYPVVDAAMDEIDAIVHLAATPDVDGSWPDALQSNIIGTYNVLETARRNNVERIVLASTNHVHGLYERDHSPDLYEIENDLMLDASTPPRPDSHYAVSKLCSEAHARYYVENYEYPKRLYVLRLGSIREAKWDHPYADAERAVERGECERDSEAYRREVKRMKATWQSHRDIAQMVECCLRDMTVIYDIFYGVSDNDRRWFDIEHAKDIIGYAPQDNGEEWSESPTD